MSLDAAMFPGLNKQALEVVSLAADRLRTGFLDLPAIADQTNLQSLQSVLEHAASELRNNYPYHHPYYLGQMMKPPHPIAQLAYTLAMSINPNNHALDGGKASSAMEKEAVQQIAAMFGWSDALGHLCGGGTIANLEALWVAREFTAGKPIAVSSQAHYTHARCCSLLGLECKLVDSDALGRLDLNSLKRLLETHEIGTVVVTLGTTALGAIDPLEEILQLQKRYGFRVHIDSAYGGYFKLAKNLGSHAAKQYQLIHLADSIVIDPHKHGLQPYGCGCVLFKDPMAARVYQHDSPYTYFSSDDLHLGEISLECSRAGAAAVALWATLKLFPLETEGDFAKRLESSITAAQQLDEWLAESRFYNPVMPPELDIVVWSVHANSASDASELARKVFDAAAKQNLHLALVNLPRHLVEQTSSISNWDQEDVTCLRACVMKPEHLEWMPKILNQFQQVTELSLHT